MTRPSRSVLEGASPCPSCAQPVRDALVDAHEFCCSDPGCPFRRIVWDEFLSEFSNYAGRAFSLSIGTSFSRRRRVRIADRQIRGAMVEALEAGLASVDQLGQVRLLGFVRSTEEH
jgi:hypothetical protein